MLSKRLTILTTRPLAQVVMDKAHENNIGIDVASFIETKNIVDAKVLNEIKKAVSKEIAVAFTSMNAVEAVMDVCEAIDASPEWTIYTLGGITNTLVKDYFTSSEVFGDASNAMGVANKIIENEEEEVIFFCGTQRREELPSTLRSKNINVNEIAVYETIETPVKVDEDYDGILFFSPSAVKSFFSVNKVIEQTVLFAIGTTTAQEIKNHSSNKVLMASQPNKELLANQAIEYLLKN